MDKKEWKWIVHEDVEYGEIYLSLRRLYDSGYGVSHEGRIIYPPNIFERLIGITHEMKYRRTKEKLQEWADYLNKLNMLEEERVKEMKRNLESWQNKYK